MLRSLRSADTEQRGSCRAYLKTPFADGPHRYRYYPIVLHPGVTPWPETSRSTSRQRARPGDATPVACVRSRVSSRSGAQCPRAARPSEAGRWTRPSWRRGRAPTRAVSMPWSMLATVMAGRRTRTRDRETRTRAKTPHLRRPSAHLSTVLRAVADPRGAYPGSRPSHVVWVRLPWNARLSDHFTHRSVGLIAGSGDGTLPSA
jgi:hypothetical protein